MPRIEMKIEASGDLSAFSTDNPDVELRILSSRLVEDGEIVLIETRMDEPDLLLRYLEGNSGIEGFEVLYTDGEELLFQYLQTPAPFQGKAAKDAKIAPQYPLLIRDGWIFNDFVASRERVVEYCEHLEGHGISHEVLAITEPQAPDALLTDRQRQFITEAIDRGYYTSPRQCSITDLARSFEVNKSTASGVLHRAESRIIEEYFANFDGSS